MNILSINLAFSTLTFWVAIRIYVAPRLDGWPPERILTPILLLHAMRHLGLMFLSPGATYADIPPEFAIPAAIGDLAAALLALASLIGLRRRWAITLGLLWVFNVEGFVDLIMAIALATYFAADAKMGPAYWIPAFWVPALLVTHAVMFQLLWRRGADLAQASAI